MGELRTVLCGGRPLPCQGTIMEGCARPETVVDLPEQSADVRGGPPLYTLVVTQYVTHRAGDPPLLVPGTHPVRWLQRRRLRQTDNLRPLVAVIVHWRCY